MIRMHHVYKYYGKNTLALEDINVHIKKAEFVFLTGSSGAGKTTLLQLIYAATYPTRGQVLVAGRNVEKLRASSVPYLRRNISVIFQDFKLLHKRTVFDNVALSLEVLGMSRNEISHRVMSVLTTTGMQRKLQAYPPELSGGEQQRVAIARALVSQPTILLADEPTGNLDKDMTGEILTMIRDFNMGGTTVVLATHDPSLFGRFGARSLHLDKGKLVEGEEH